MLGMFNLLCATYLFRFDLAFSIDYYCYTIVVYGRRQDAAYQGFRVGQDHGEDVVERWPSGMVRGAFHDEVLTTKSSTL